MRARRALLVSGYAGEPVRVDDGRGRMVTRRAPLTAAQVAVAGPEVVAALEWLTAPGPGGVLIHGAAPGIDELADVLARERKRGATILPMPAQWDEYGRKAGMMRNESMIRVLGALIDCGYEPRGLCLPGPRSRGTWHMRSLLCQIGMDPIVRRLP